MKSVKVAADYRAIKRDDKLRLNLRNGIHIGKDFIRLSRLLLNKTRTKSKTKIWYTLLTNTKHNKYYNMREIFNLLEKMKLTPDL